MIFLKIEEADFKKVVRLEIVWLMYVEDKRNKTIQNLFLRFLCVRECAFFGLQKDLRKNKIWKKFCWIPRNCDHIQELYYNIYIYILNHRKYLQLIGGQLMNKIMILGREGELGSDQVQIQFSRWFAFFYLNRIQGTQLSHVVPVSDTGVEPTEGLLPSVSRPTC